MKEQFDKRLVDKIKVSFQQHEEPLDPQELEKFKTLYFGQKNTGFKRIGAFWWMGIAASLVIGILLLNQMQFDRLEEGKNSAELLSSNESIVKEQFSKEEQNSVQEKVVEKDAGIEINEIEKRNRISTESKVPNGSLSGTDIEAIESNEEKVFPFIPMITEAQESTNEKQNNLQINEALMDSSQAMNIAQDSVDRQNTLDYIKNWLGDGVEIDKNQTITKNDQKNDPMKLGILVAPQTISNATQALSLGAGMMSEFSFSKRLKLDVGLAYARQQITPTTSSRNMLQSADAFVSNALDVAASAESARAAFSGNFINASTELSFGQLEIPINLKYKVLENKNSDVYFISGFSNMMYLNQQNTTTFSTANLNHGNFVGMQPAIQTYTQTESPSTGSGNIDSGQMLNFGFGYEQSLKNGTFLSIEPFYKFSLGDQTFNNQQFSIGGINLRMNFQLKNKKE